MGNHAEKKTIVPTKFKTPEEHLEDLKKNLHPKFTHFSDEDLLIFFPQCKEIRKTSRVGEKYQVNFIPNYQSKEEYENQLLLKIMHEKKEIKKNTTTPILTRAKTAESQKIITTEEENEKNEKEMLQNNENDDKKIENKNKEKECLYTNYKIGDLC